jgi:hypothetical protein
MEKRMGRDGMVVGQGGDEGRCKCAGRVVVSSWSRWWCRSSAGVEYRSSGTENGKALGESVPPRNGIGPADSWKVGIPDHGVKGVGCKCIPYPVMTQNSEF